MHQFHPSSFSLHIHIRVRYGFRCPAVITITGAAVVFPPPSTSLSLRNTLLFVQKSCSSSSSNLLFSSMNLILASRVVSPPSQTYATLHCLSFSLIHCMTFVTATGYISYTRTISPSNHRRLQAVWPHSGRYRPTPENFQDFITFMRENDLDYNLMLSCFEKLKRKL